MLCLQKCQSRQGKNSKDILLYFFAFVLFFKAIYFDSTFIAAKNHWGQIIAQLVQIINENNDRIWLKSWLLPLFQMKDSYDIHNQDKLLVSISTSLLLVYHK